MAMEKDKFDIPRQFKVQFKVTRRNISKLIAAMTLLLFIALFRPCQSLSLCLDLASILSEIHSSLNNSISAKM